MPAEQALRLLLEKGAGVRAVDVRSEGEFAQAAVPGFRNFPILDNAERHEVGTCYKQNGQDAAIALGQKLVAPSREARTESWKTALAGAEYPLLTCFRGGLRSQIATDWLRNAGVSVIKVEGGYKQMRQELLSVFSNLPEFFVVAGPTGAGKSKLLRECGRAHLDLEALACHRGSAFGGLIHTPQPTQATFENLVAFQLRRSSPLLVEDESAMIGHICLPPELKNKIVSGKVIRIRMSVEERVQHLYQEYVLEPLAKGLPAATLLGAYLKSLRNIEKRLGGLVAGELQGKLQIAFAGANPELHFEWIRGLLLHYYDKAYDYSFQKIPRETAFEGDWLACKQWIQEKFG